MPHGSHKQCECLLGYQSLGREYKGKMRETLASKCSMLARRRAQVRAMQLLDEQYAQYAKGPQVEEEG